MMELFYQGLPMLLLFLIVFFYDSATHTKIIINILNSSIIHAPRFSSSSSLSRSSVRLRNKHTIMFDAYVTNPHTQKDLLHSDRNFSSTVPKAAICSCSIQFYSNLRSKSLVIFYFGNSLYSFIIS